MAQAPKALGYFREDGVRARGRQRQEALVQQTLADQNRAFLDFCKREGYEVAATFLDTDVDGSERSGFRQLTDYMRRNAKAEWVVVVVSIDRLGRTPTEAAKSLFQLDGLGARLISLDGVLDPTRALLDQWRRRDPGIPIGDRVREAMRKKAIRGEVLGRPPYGYGVGAKHRLEPIPDEASIVRYIYRLYTREGLGIRLIARRLNEESYRTRRGGNWSMITIRDILLNRAYLGTYTRFGVRVPGSHTALVSPEDFRRAQDRMASRRTGGGERNVRRFLLSGMANCAACGNRMIGVSRRQTWTRRGDGGQGEAEYRYYQCLTRTNQSMCDYHTWRVQKLDEEVRRQAALGVKEGLDAPEAAEATHAPVREDVERLRQRVHQLDRTLEQYMQAAANGEMSVGRLRELSVEVTQQQYETDEAIAGIEGKRRVIASQSDQRRLRQAQLVRLEAGWESLSFDEQRDLIREVVERVDVHDDTCIVRLRT